MMADMYAERSTDEVVEQAFALFDETGVGSVAVRDLRRLCRELGEPLPDEDLQCMIDEYDSEGQGCISMADFRRMMEEIALH
mmetsp:Transcript_7581/g.22174  ORF Transcript_7581/g.22174 Transcript_7581/m.22174 type:complete len:82 (+) Transcript_7581:218-463(+)